MSKINRFEDIKAWQKAREISKQVYVVTSTGMFSRDFGLKDQIRRAAVSVMSNIAEGYARKTNREFAYFLFISHGSLAEIQSLSYVALDQGYIDRPSFERTYSLCDEVSKMLSGLITYLSRRKQTLPTPRTL